MRDPSPTTQARVARHGGREALALALQASRADTLATFAACESALPDLRVPLRAELNPRCGSWVTSAGSRRTGCSATRSATVACAPTDAPRAAAEPADADALYHPAGCRTTAAGGCRCPTPTRLGRSCSASSTERSPCWLARPSTTTRSTSSAWRCCTRTCTTRPLCTWRRGWASRSTTRAGSRARCRHRPTRCASTREAGGWAATHAASPSTMSAGARAHRAAFRDRRTGGALGRIPALRRGRAPRAAALVDRRGRQWLLHRAPAPRGTCDPAATAGSGGGTAAGRRSTRPRPPRHLTCTKRKPGAAGPAADSPPRPSGARRRRAAAALALGRRLGMDRQPLRAFRVRRPPVPRLLGPVVRRSAGAARRVVDDAAADAPPALPQLLPGRSKRRAGRVPQLRGLDTMVARVIAGGRSPES